jgi:hypothetical protein
MLILQSLKYASVQFQAAKLTQDLGRISVLESPDKCAFGAGVYSDCAAVNTGMRFTAIGLRDKQFTIIGLNDKQFTAIGLKDNSQLLDLKTNN